VGEPFFLPGEAMPPLEAARLLESGSPELDRYLGEQIYVNLDLQYVARQRQRLAETVRLHAERVGDRPTYLLRAPGRLNAFLEYLDMCAGDHMSTTIDGDIPVAVSLRDDDTVTAANANPLFPLGEFSISEELAAFASAPWTGPAAAGLEDNWDNRTRLFPFYRRPQGDWLNYVRCSFLRVAWQAPALELRGVDLTFGPATAPFRAGTSSSSAIVVLAFLALHLANRDLLPKWDVHQICKLLGEAEWYVGTHGGANDQTTILRNMPNGVLYNRHSLPRLDSTPLPFLRGVRVVLANSLWEVNKALSANEKFNLRKGWMDLGNDLMKLIIESVRSAQREGKAAGEGWLPRLLDGNFGLKPGRPPALLESDARLWETIEERYARFGSLDERLLGIPSDAIQELASLLPEKIVPQDAGRLLGKDRTALERDYTLPSPEEDGYRVRAAALFFHKENFIGRALERLFLEADARLTSGELSEGCAEYDAYRIEVGRLVEQLQDTLRDDFQVSNSQLDLLLDIARRGPGYLGGKLTGAGSGGCASILVRQGQEDAFCRFLDRQYYGKPKHFELYRHTLDALERDSAPGTPERAAALEMRRNLDTALAAIPDQRRVVTFSRGACAIELPASP